MKGSAERSWPHGDLARPADSLSGVDDRTLADEATPPDVVEPTTPADEEEARLFADASSDYRQWRADSRDDGANRERRLAALRSLTAYYLAHRASRGSAEHLVEAAYAIAAMKRVVGDVSYRTWLQNVVSAWDAYAERALPAGVAGSVRRRASRYEDYAAEAELTLLDERITAAHDDGDRHKYPPTVVEIFGEVDIDPQKKAVILGPDGRPRMKKVGKYQRNAMETTKWDLELEKLLGKYDSRRWAPVVMARQGSLFDTLRRGLSAVSNVTVLTANELSLLLRLRQGNRTQLAAELEAAKADFWRMKKQQELDGCDKMMIRRYAGALELARVNHVVDARITQARKRLEYYTDVIGDAKMAEIVTSTPDPTTRGSTMLTYRERQYLQAL